jgi:uncharacterized membrane protein YgcG
VITDVWPRRATRVLAALLFALAGLAATAAALGQTPQEREEITRFHSEVQIQADGSLLVTETIDVRALGHEVRRGILRDFPTDYRDRLGNRVTVPFEVLEVTRAGAPEPFIIERLSNGVRVRIGSPGVSLPHTIHRYEIRYRTARQLGFFETHDELYWNVTGNGWTLTILEASARVQLPVNVEAARLTAQSFRGTQGQTTPAAATVTDGGASFASVGMLWPREGLTVVLTFPKGLIPAPTTRERIGWFVEANKALGVGVIGTLLLVLGLAWRWRAVGRDPKAGPLFPRYEPSAGLSAGAARYVDQMGFDAKCFAAGILHLGARGHLRVDQQGEGFEVTQAQRSGPWLPGDQPLVDALFGAGPSIVLGKTYDPRAAAAQKSYREALARQYNGVMFATNLGTTLVAIVVAVLIVIACNMAGGSPLMNTAIALVLLLVIVACWRWMPAYSVQGRKLRDEIEGLRQYLGVAERSTLTQMRAPELTPQEFARMLPFALALGVEKTWADKFAAVAGATAVAAAVDSYYHGDGMHEFGAQSLGNSLSSLSSSVSSASTPPGSSSGSGGSSGGGGGGGGGSGW